jgi:hypothetical protein
MGHIAETGELPQSKLRGFISTCNTINITSCGGDLSQFYIKSHTISLLKAAGVVCSISEKINAQSSASTSNLEVQLSSLIPVFFSVNLPAIKKYLRS